MLVGGSLLSKLGALVLVIGIALFLGYSFGHVTPAGRAAMALIVSVGILGAGIRVERMGAYKIFARGLIGAGWAALYATPTHLRNSGCAHYSRRVRGIARHDRGRRRHDLALPSLPGASRDRGRLLCGFRGHRGHAFEPLLR
jgi:Predicted membrane protein (DUF2339)